MNRTTLYLSLFTLACMFLPAISFAQGPPDPNDVPIDGGISLLLAAGAVYGIKKYREGKKRERVQDNL